MQPLMTSDQIQSAVEKLADQIAAVFRRDQLDFANLALVGIRRRGELLAGRVGALLSEKLGHKPLLGALDITMYRDDVLRHAPITIPMGTEMDFRLDDRPVILLDDVLFTGRSVRAALDALVDFGRPRFIRLAVLFDRAGREYPIAADFVGALMDVPPHSVIQVQLKPLDAVDLVCVVPAQKQKERAAL